MKYNLEADYRKCFDNLLHAGSVGDSRLLALMKCDVSEVS